MSTVDWTVGNHLGKISRDFDALLSLLKQRPDPVTINIFVTGDHDPEQLAASIEAAISKREAAKPGARRI